MNPVATPVVIENARELREERVDKFLGWHRVGNGVFPPAASRPWRHVHVVEHRPELNGADGEADCHGDECEA
ncbi:hypothetical protein D3C83_195340 [compost metagenome]